MMNFKTQIFSAGSKPALRAILLSGVCLAVALPSAAQTVEEPDEIIVTATKREQTLLEVPISMTVFGAKELETRGASRMKDLMMAIPNVSLFDASGANSSDSSDLVIRGVSTNARNVGFESGVSMYLDGVYTGRPASFNQDLVGIERIEVLRGPQGTLFGKNTISGAVNITTAQPSLEAFSAGLMAEYAEFNTKRANAYVNIPLSESAAVRVSAYTKQSDGFVENVFNGETYNNEGAEGGRIQLRLEPSENFDLTFSADYLSEDHNLSFPEVISGGPIVPGIRTVNIDFSPIEEREVLGLSATGNYKLANGGIITSVTGYRDTKDVLNGDNDHLPLAIAHATFTEDESHFTQELRYTSPGGEKFEYVLGAFYLNQSANADKFFAFDPDGPGATFPVLPIRVLADVDTTSYAVFADSQYHLTDALTFNAGLRFTQEKKTLNDYSTSAPGVLGTIGIFNEFSGITDSYSESDVSPVIGLSYAISDNVNTYVKLARGFKSGGWNVDFFASPLVPTLPEIDFDDEETTNYEAGIKADLANNFAVNLAVFKMDYKNLQVNQQTAFGFVITNAGAADIAGAEVDFTWRPADGLTLTGGAGYVDSTYDTFANCTPTGVDCSGNRLINSPKWTANFAGDWGTDIGELGRLSLHADYAYRGDYFTNAINDPTFQVGSFSLVNASVSFGASDSDWKATLFVNNVFDKEYLTGLITDGTGLFPGAVLGGYGAPRMVGGRVSLNFK